MLGHEPFFWTMNEPLSRDHSPRNLDVNPRILAMAIEHTC